MKHVKQYEIHSDFLNPVKPFEGQQAFKIHNNELIRTIESMGHIYLTYEEYQKVKDLAEAVKKKCDNLDEQKKLEIQRLKLVIGKVKKDMKIQKNADKYNL